MIHHAMARQRSTPVAALLFALAAMPLSAIEAAPAKDTTPAWLEVVAAPSSAPTIAEIYQSLLVTQFMPGDLVDDPAAVERFRGSEDYRFQEHRSSTDVASGSLAGQWKFHNPGAQRWPTQALRIEFPEPDRYKVRATLYCIASRSDCTRLMATTRQMKAPQPSWNAGESLRRQWYELVVRERCSAGPHHAPAPRYPPAALRSEISGVVTLRILLNPCGEVRGTWITASSRNRDLDRAAVAAVQEWRLQPLPPPMTNTGGMISVPVRFSLEDAESDSPAYATPP